MKKTLLILIILMMSILSINVFSVSVNIKKEYNLSYSETPDETFSITDLNRYGDVYTLYTGRDFPLPRYIPQYLEMKGYLFNRSAMQQRVIGTYTPRYFDGEKYTNFHTDTYNTYDVNETEKAYLDEISLTISPIKVSNGKCTYMAYWQNSRDFVEDYSVDSSKKILDIWYFYDLGYWYVPEIRKAFVNDCYYTFSANRISYGSSYSYAYFDTKINKIRIDKYISNICERENDLLSTSVNYAFFRIKYNASSNVEASMKIYDDPLSTINTDGTCTNGALIIPCFPSSQFYADVQTKDDWMLKVRSGNYIPRYVTYQGKDLDTYLSQSDAVYRDCKNNYLKNFLTSAFSLKIGQTKTQWQNCQNYLQSKRKDLLKISTDFTQQGVENMIWNYYKTTYNIPKGTNLYPLNIVLSGIRCKQNDTWKQYKPTPISPNSQTPYVECNYTQNDSQVVEVGYKFDVFVNPVFSMIAGADNIQQSYNTELIKSLFLKYKTYLEQTNNGANVTQLSLNILNQSTGGQIVSSFSVNRSKDNGCSYVFKTYQQANKTVNQVTDLAYKTQVEAEQKPAEVIRSLEVQLKLLKSEVEKTQFYFYVDVFAQLIFRGFQIFYYVIEIVLLLYVVKLTFQIPTTIITVLNTLGESKKKRKQESILNK